MYGYKTETENHGKNIIIKLTKTERYNNTITITQEKIINHCPNSTPDCEIITEIKNTMEIFDDKEATEVSRENSFTTDVEKYIKIYQRNLD